MVVNHIQCKSNYIIDFFVRIYAKITFGVGHSMRTPISVLLFMSYNYIIADKGYISYDSLFFTYAFCYIKAQ